MTVAAELQAAAPARSAHGLAAITENLYLGAMAVEVTVHGQALLMSDREFRDVLLCARDLFPSMFAWPLPEQPIEAVAR